MQGLTEAATFTPTEGMKIEGYKHITLAQARLGTSSKQTSSCGVYKVATLWIWYPEQLTDCCVKQSIVLLSICSSSPSACVCRWHFWPFSLWTCQGADASEEPFPKHLSDCWGWVSFTSVAIFCWVVWKLWPLNLHGGPDTFDLAIELCPFWSEQWWINSQVQRMDSDDGGWEVRSSATLSLCGWGVAGCTLDHHTGISWEASGEHSTLSISLLALRGLNPCCPLLIAMESDALQIDFVAHDDLPYSGAGTDDIYKYIKAAGKSHSCPQKKVQFQVL